MIIDITEQFKHKKAYVDSIEIQIKALTRFLKRIIYLTAKLDTLTKSKSLAGAVTHIIFTN